MITRTGTGPGGKNAKAVDVIHSSPAKYDWIMAAVMCIVPLSMLFSFGTIANDPDPSTRRRGVSSILTSSVALAVVFSLVLPRRFDVLSDSSIRVVTLCGKHWVFDKVIDAFDRQGIIAEPFRPKFKFATSFLSDDRVVVRRELGCWDLLVSPSDPATFVQAIKSLHETVDDGDLPTIA